MKAIRTASDYLNMNSREKKRFIKKVLRASIEDQRKIMNNKKVSKKP